jgi:hypothetical protein
VFVERDEEEQSEVVALAIDGVAPERQRHFTAQALDLGQTWETLVTPRHGTRNEEVGRQETSFSLR